MQITAYYGIVLDACIALSCQKLVNKNQTIGGSSDGLHSVYSFYIILFYVAHFKLKEKFSNTILCNCAL